jgi:hypothetical protein
MKVINTLALSLIARLTSSRKEKSAMILITRVFAVALLLAVFATPVVVADELCEVTSPDGTVVFVPCCEITVDGSDQSEDCQAVAAALDSAEINALEDAVARNNLHKLAKFLRANPSIPYGAFTIEPPLQELLLRCCSCVPGKSCSVNLNWDVCTVPNNDGTCPAGTLRTICSTDPSGEGPVLECTSVDL